jgi:hypothetical protein
MPEIRSFAPKCKTPFFLFTLIDSENGRGRDRLGLQRQFGFACWLSRGMREKRLRSRNATSTSSTLHTCPTRSEANLHQNFVGATKNADRNLSFGVVEQVLSTSQLLFARGVRLGLIGAEENGELDSGFDVKALSCGAFVLSLALKAS